MFFPKLSLVELPADSMRPIGLPDRIYAILKRRLLTCVIKPGDRMKERTLCEDLEVSRTPLREALNRLSNEGLIVYQVNAGYRAAPISVDGFTKLNEIRLVVESQVAALAAKRAIATDIAAMRLAATMPPIAEGDDESFAAYCKANASFHLLVVRSTGNSLFAGLVMAALDQFQIPAFLGVGRQLDSSNPSGKHHQIVDAIEARDEALASALMARHVVGGGDRIIEALKEAGY